MDLHQQFDLRHVINACGKMTHLAGAIVTSDAEGFRDVLLSDEPPSITYNTEVSDDILGEDEAIKGYELPINTERIRIVPVEEMFKRVS